jgi:hypothetical protein
VFPQKRGGKKSKKLEDTLPVYFIIDHKANDFIKQAPVTYKSMIDFSKGVIDLLSNESQITYKHYTTDKYIQLRCNTCKVWVSWFTFEYIGDDRENPKNIKFCRNINIKHDREQHKDIEFI